MKLRPYDPAELPVVPRNLILGILLAGEAPGGFKLWYQTAAVGIRRWYHTAGGIKRPVVYYRDQTEATLWYL